MFERVLIANRGEIACRVARTLKRLGIVAIGVYSDADARAAHVQVCDEAWRLGPAAAALSYLNAHAILEAARRSGAQAVHPGYGFLSENPDFAQDCEDAGLVFIGPPPSAIRAMGLKSASKALMARAGLPLVPGYHGDAQDLVTLRQAADATGYPILIKASAGGGGKGMRVVRTAGELEAALEAARREAQASFGDDRVLVERYLPRPRHIEVQIFADRHDHCIHLFERDCSVQRRHQKVLEEAPAPGMTPARRRQMGSAAVAAARAVGYVNAGTVEFIVDDQGAFYFMEMNTRLQVEHPVTEMVTGLDLVEWQLRVAAGEPLPLAQEDITLRGHAIEARICAEEPRRDFAPAPGQILHLRLPTPTPWLRLDGAVREGETVSVHYDPMLAKLVAWGQDRDEAVARLRGALGELEVGGIATNVDFLGAILRHPSFARAQQDPSGLDTGLIERHRAELLPPLDEVAEEFLVLAAVSEALHLRGQARASAQPHSPWSAADGWRLNAPPRLALRFALAGQAVDLTIRPLGGGAFRLALPARELALEAWQEDGGLLCVSLEARFLRGRTLRESGYLTVFCGGRSLRLELETLQESAEDTTTGNVRAPMPASVVALLVEPGAVVTAGQPLVVIEAMKMQHTILAPAAGTVRGLPFAVGDPVGEGQPLVEFEATED